MPPRPDTHSQRAVPLLAVAGVLLFVLGVYGIYRATSSGQVLGSVRVLDVELGGSTPEEATASLAELEDRLGNAPVPVTIQGEAAEIVPFQAGFEIANAALVDQAMSIGRSDNPLSDFFWWISHIGRTTILDPRGDLDSEALDVLLSDLDQSIIGEPPFEGGVELVEGELVARYPQRGRRVDRDVALDLVTRAALSLERQPVELPIRDEQPQLTAADVDAARQEAEQMLSAPIELVAEEGTALTFTTEDLRNAFFSVTHDEPARIELGFSVEAIEAKLEGVRSEFEAEPVNASFEINGYEVAVVPGRRGTRIDAEETAAALVEASRTPGRRGTLPLVEGAEPDRTTESLEALDIRHLVSQFTTYFDCCGPRVTNIQLIAAEVDGAIVAPGATFSLNDYVGQRTEAEGYLEDGTIVRGEIVDTVGGGVSQFATTFYNAVFWGGYEDVQHKPHSFYFDRYPEGIEATISWPVPDLVFRNNTDSGILIKTAATDTSVTVRFYGNNDGRILAGEQSGGQLRMGVVAEGGPAARQVRGDRSERYDIRQPPEPMYRGNPDLGVDESVRVQGSRDGWSVRVTRTITVGDNTSTQEWVVIYLPQQEIIEVHPCRVPDGGVACPTTTTTTVTTVPETTSTTVPDTTTTTAPEETTTSTTPTTVPEG